jgi:hypothetical protein
VHVGVDEPGHDEAIARVDGGGGGALRLDLRPRPHRDDLPSADADGASFHEADAGAGHGEEVPAGDQGVEHHSST